MASGNEDAREADPLRRRREETGVDAFVALGSNLGDREGALRFALEALCEAREITFVAGSRVYETDPVGPPPQGPYLNAVVALRVTLEPRALLERLLEVEGRAGRSRSPDPALRNQARTLDLDLLLYAEDCIDEPALVVPHPRLHERAFVLEPLCELAGARVHPRLGERIDVLAARVRDPAAVRSWTGPLGAP